MEKMKGRLSQRETEREILMMRYHERQKNRTTRFEKRMKLWRRKVVHLVERWYGSSNGRASE